MNSETIDSAKIIRDLKTASGRGAALGSEPRQQLEWLCRKIHVAKRVDARYRLGWKKDPGSSPLDLGLWTDLVDVLLHYSVVPEGSDEERRGLGLKFANAAFAAVDLAVKERAANTDGLLQRCRERLSQIEQELGA